MTTVVLPTDYSALRGKTILITGCATGIGREVAKLAYENGANLALADINETDAHGLMKELGDESRLVFKRVDVTDWESFRNLFDATIEKFGIVHAVISNAGMHHEALLKEEFDDNGKLKSPNTNSIDINLVSHLYASKLAFHYFKKGQPGPRQIVYTGSAASYIDTAPLYQYGAAKAGTLGLMRAFRQTAQKVDVSVNMVAPWMTETNMMPQFIADIWGDLPRNTPLGIAKALLLPVVDPSIHGKSFWVGGNEVVELEDKIQETQPLWMGAEMSAGVNEGNRRMLALATSPADAMAGAP
ncbi:hypothetical protein E8E14_002796 [Neopestalotiopsis sp. 37M]|nr:hypothetical protein E8E14_002796 [Neopestalotiopsis sp. 37M]